MASDDHQSAYDHPYSPLSDQDNIPHTSSTTSSTNVSRGGSRPPREKHRVRFQSGGESLDQQNHREMFDVTMGVSSQSVKEGKKPRRGPRPVGPPNPLELSTLEPLDSKPPFPLVDAASEDITQAARPDPSSKARPSIMRPPSGDAATLGLNPLPADEGQEQDDKKAAEKAASQRHAQRRAERVSRETGSHSAPGSKTASPFSSAPNSPPLHPQRLINWDDWPREKMKQRTKYGIEDDTDEETDEYSPDDQSAKKKHLKNPFYKAAAGFVRHHTRGNVCGLSDIRVPPPSDSRSGHTTPVYEREAELYVPKPKAYREGFLSSILKLYQQEGQDSTGETSRLNESGTTSPLSSGHSTPKQQRQHEKKWYLHRYSASNSSVGSAVDSTTTTTTTTPTTTGELPANEKALSSVSLTSSPLASKTHKKNPRKSVASTTDKIPGHGKKNEETIQIKLNIAEVLTRQAYLLRLCKALMKYGAPTHRLEEYMQMSTRILEIEGHYLYLPNCMIVSFDDAQTHTTEVKLVRTNQEPDLSRLSDVHEMYKRVIHDDNVSVSDAITRLDEIMKRKPRYPRWVLVIVSGLASASVGPFAFGARPIDIPLAFLLGSLVGFMQLVLNPMSNTYANLFEICATVLTSFLARAFGSIKNGELFCFSALAQSAIALILPGYIVLCGALELQSKNIVAGSVRMVYSVIYSLFLGFGITIGTSLYGAIDKTATSAVNCTGEMPRWYPWLFVPIFTFCLIILNQGRFKQMPVMLAVALAGYFVNFFSGRRFKSNAQLANTFGAFTIGVLGNLYSRFGHGLAVTAILPAIFVQVPSGLAASGSLVSGVTSANQITNHSINGTLVNGTTTVSDGSSGASIQSVDVNTMVFNVGYSMIQVSIGITVGLFLSALVVYPLGKKRSGLFSF